MIDYCISSLSTNFEVFRGHSSRRYNLFHASVYRPVRPNRDLKKTLLRTYAFYDPPYFWSLAVGLKAKIGIFLENKELFKL